MSRFGGLSEERLQCLRPEASLQTVQHGNSFDDLHQGGKEDNDSLFLQESGRPSTPTTDDIVQVVAGRVMEGMVSLKRPLLNLTKANWTALGLLHDRDCSERLAAYQLRSGGRCYVESSLSL
ncbi:hypothetical protein TNCV_4910511 [Trichonephila clavipes]|nr:hypothetical protein TNCV_4910511 [Trichonephila clavipes]